MNRLPRQPLLHLVQGVDGRVVVAVCRKRPAPTHQERRVVRATPRLDVLRQRGPSPRPDLERLPAELFGLVGELQVQVPGAGPAERRVRVRVPQLGKGVLGGERHRPRAALELEEGLDERSLGRLHLSQQPERSGVVRTGLDCAAGLRLHVLDVRRVAHRQHERQLELHVTGRCEVAGATQQAVGHPGPGVRIVLVVGLPLGSGGVEEQQSGQVEHRFGVRLDGFGGQPLVDDRVEGDVLVRVALVEIEVVAAAEIGVLQGRGQQAVDDQVEPEPAGEAVQYRLHLRRVVEPGALGERRHDRSIGVQQRQRTYAGVGLVTRWQDAGEVDLPLHRLGVRGLGHRGQHERRHQHRGAHERPESLQRHSGPPPAHAGIQLHAARGGEGSAPRGHVAGDRGGRGDVERVDAAGHRDDRSSVRGRLPAR